MAFRIAGVLVLVGCQGHRPEPWRVPDGPTIDPGSGNLPPTARRWHGEALDLAGWAIDLADVLPDEPGEEILIGTPSTCIYGPSEPHAGAYLLLSSAESGGLDDVARTFFVPSYNGDLWGQGIAGVGDITGDGQPDVVVGGQYSESPYLGLPVFSAPDPGDVRFDEASAWWAIGARASLRT